MKRRFLLTHNKCSGKFHIFKDRVEPCNNKTHPGGSVHIRPLSMNWRQLISRHRAREIFGVDLKPGDQVTIEVSIIRH